MTQDKEKNENVVNLAEARRRQRTIHRAGANGKDRDPKGKGPKGASGQPTGWRRILLYGQFVLFLAIVAYMMQLCKGG